MKLKKKSEILEINKHYDVIKQAITIYCIKCLIFSKNDNIKVKREIGEKVIFIFIVMTAFLKSLQLLMKKNLVTY